MSLHRYACGLVLAALAGSPAAAQVGTPIGYLIPQAAVMSDSRFEGVSISGSRPTVMASLYLWRPDGYYAGAEATRVRFDDGRSTDVQLVAYAGRNFEHGPRRLTLEAMAVLFPDQKGMGQPRYDFVQVSAKARRRFAALDLGASVSYTADASYNAGPAWKAVGDAVVTVTPWLSLSGRYGVYESLRRQDRTFFDVGAVVTRGKVAFDLRYADTNLARAQCFFTDNCAPAVVGKLTFTFADLK